MSEVKHQTILGGRQIVPKDSREGPLALSYLSSPLTYTRAPEATAPAYSGQLGGRQRRAERKRARQNRRRGRR